MSFFGVARNDRFPDRDSCRQPAEVAQTAGLNCLFFVRAVASTSEVAAHPQLAAVKATAVETALA